MSRDIHAPIENVKEDILGRQVLAEKIYSRLCGDECPQAIGVYGGWGTGKTSLLNLIDIINKDKIQSGQGGIYIETIDAWAYEIVSSLFVPIIVAVKRFAAEEVLSEATTQKYLRRLGKIALLGASDIVLKKLGLSLDDVKKLIVDANETAGEGVSYLDWENLVDDVKSMRDAFGELVKVSLEGLRKKGYRSERIVFCIDNLDRCSPENTINLLESIRNFLTVPGCTWVLAVDSDVIASYIFKKYEDTAVDGYSYLDKIVPEQYHLSLSPTLDREKITDILNSVAQADDDIPFRIDESKIPQIPKILVPRRLIKSANKFYEYYQNPALGVSPDIVLSLVLLYHTWPAFYIRLSSASEEHISGILNHFFDNDSETLSHKNKIPLSEKFSKDDELVYFIRTAFMDYKSGKMAPLIQEILLALKQLRQLGLP